MIYSSTVGGGAMGMVSVPRREVPLSKTFLYSNKKGTRYGVSVIKTGAADLFSANDSVAVANKV